MTKKGLWLIFQSLRWFQRCNSNIIIIWPFPFQNFLQCVEGNGTRNSFIICVTWHSVVCVESAWDRQQALDLKTSQIVVCIFCQGKDSRMLSSQQVNSPSLPKPWITKKMLPINTYQYHAFSRLCSLPLLTISRCLLSCWIGGKCQKSATNHQKSPTYPEWVCRE